MKNDSIIGADDFADVWSKDNADAFVVKQAPVEPAQNNAAGKPQFVSSTPGTNPAKKPSLTELMMAANENPGATI